MTEVEIFHNQFLLSTHAAIRIQEILASNDIEARELESSSPGLPASISVVIGVSRYIRCTCISSPSYGVGISIVAVPVVEFPTSIIFDTILG
jgi:hypothetical protein